jgi:nucleoside-diphosphate-sugar epimerase
MAERSGTVVVTGYPGFIGRRLVQRMVELRRPGRLVLLAQSSTAAAARAHLSGLEVADAEIWECDVTRMHLGLAGSEFKSLVREATEIWHLAASSRVEARPDEMRRVNVEGTRNVLELARAARRLERLYHFSSALVSGDRQGVILEDELEMGQRYRNPYEESKARAEALVRRAMVEVPTTVFRPATVVGDSRTGEIDRFEGPYYLAILLVSSPIGTPLPLAGGGGAPLNVVPVDFVVEAALAMARHPSSTGRTVHVVDPAPLSARRVYEMIAARVGRRMPPVSLPHRLLETLLALPLVDRFSRQHRAAVESVNHLAFYNPMNQLELLSGSGVSCPPITTYLDRLIDFVRSDFERRRKAEVEAEAEDPLAPPQSPGVEPP